MPYLTRLYVKTAFAYFVAALTVGAVVGLRPWLPASIPVGVLSPLYFHLFMVGWVLHLIVGVAEWMFPRWSREQPRGPRWVARLAYGALNLGLLLRVVTEPAYTLTGAPVWAWGMVISAVAQWVGGAAVVANLWPRVKER
jgi:hypothetical protein